MGDIDPYRVFVETFAPYGYARLFDKLGDFTKAQRALERTLIKGQSLWSEHSKGDSMSPGLMDRMIELWVQKVEGEGDEAESTSSFSQSPKLRAISAAGAIHSCGPASRSEPSGGRRHSGPQRGETG